MKRLSAPKQLTWWFAVILGVLGLLGQLRVISILSPLSFWFVLAGLILLLLGTLFKGL